MGGGYERGAPETIKRECRKGWKWPSQLEILGPAVSDNLALPFFCFTDNYLVDMLGVRHEFVHFAARKNPG